MNEPLVYKALLMLTPWQSSVYLYDTSAEVVNALVEAGWQIAAVIVENEKLSTGEQQEWVSKPNQKTRQSLNSLQTRS